jgi:hypothetical protein
MAKLQPASRRKVRLRINCFDFDIFIMGSRRARADARPNTRPRIERAILLL